MTYYGVRLCYRLWGHNIVQRPVNTERTQVFDLQRIEELPAQIVSQGIISSLYLSIDQCIQETSRVKLSHRPLPRCPLLPKQWIMLHVCHWENGGDGDRIAEVLTCR